MKWILILRKFASLILGKKMKYEQFSLEDADKYMKYAEEKSLYFNPVNSKVDMKILRNQFEIISYIYNIKYVVIDHFDYIHSSEGKSSLESIDEAMRELHILALEFKLAIILVVHPKQLPRGTEISMNDLKGSSSIKQYADNIIIVTRMDMLDHNDLNRVKIRVYKNRFCGTVASFYMRYIPQIDGYEDEIKPVDFNQFTKEVEE